MAEIQLTRGKVVLVDVADFEWLSQWNWYFCKGYARRKGLKLEGSLYGRGVYMHRQILNLLDSEIEVDHVNHNTLDNRRLNLRVCSRTQNLANSPLRKGSTFGYKGISVDRRCKSRPWQSQIQVGKEHFHLGCFSTKEQAALAYNKAALRYFGEFACLNEVVKK